MEVQFTEREAEALLHRLELADCIEQVFADTPDLEDLAPRVEDRAHALRSQLEGSKAVTVNPDDRLDRELMTEAIEGSTWIACVSYAPKQDQKRLYAQHEKILRSAAKRIQVAFGMAVGPSIPSW